MAREGEHNAQLKISGDTQSADKELQQLTRRMQQMEQQTERQAKAFDHMSKKQKISAEVLEASQSKMQRFAGSMSEAWHQLNGYAAALTVGVVAIDKITARTRDYADANANLRFDVGQLAQAVDNGATQFELLGAAADLQSTSLNLSQQQMNDLFSSVDKFAAAHRQELIPTLEAATKAINKGNVDRLRGIGIQTDMTKALDEEAKRLGINTNQMTLAQRQSVAYQEVTRALNTELAGQTNEVDGLAFSWERWKHKQIDAGDSILQSLNDITSSFMRLAEGAGEAEVQGTSFWDAMISGRERYFSIGDPLSNAANILKDTADSIDQSVATLKGEEDMFARVRDVIGEKVEALRAEREERRALDDAMLQQQQLQTQGNALLNEELRDIELKLAFFGPQTKMQDETNRLMARRAEILAFQLELEGKVDEAQRVRFQEELRQAQAGGQMLARRGGGRRRSGESTKIVDAFEFTPDARREMQGGGATSQLAGESEMSLRESQDKFIEQQMDFNQRKLDAELEFEMQRIAIREELGILEPLDAIAFERDAQLEHIDGLRKMTSDEIELQRLKNREELVYHQAHMRRVELERQAELKKWKTTSEVAAAINQITQGGIQTGAMAADMFIVNEKRREQARYASGAVAALVTGIEQQVQAIAAFASFNYVGGALHQAAAIFAFAQSGMLFAKAGGAGGGGGRARGLEAGFGASAGAGGTGAANGPANGRGGEGLQNQIQSDVPPSQAPTASGPTSQGQQQQQGGVNISGGTFHLYGTPQDEFIDSITRGQERRSRSQRRAI